MQRDASIDSLRGLAILLMVAGHVIGNSSAVGMKVADDSEWRSFYVLLDDIRMPLFTVLSGYVYAMRPVTQFGRIPQMLRGKARRLLVPLLTVGTFFYVVQAYTPGTNRPPPLENIWHV